MRITPPLLVGTGLLGLIVSLSTQGQSVPDIAVSASTIGAQVALNISAQPKEEIKIVEHTHEDPVKLAAEIEAEKRTEARKTQVKPAAPKQRLLTALDKPDIEMRHKLIANNVLMSLPETCRDTLQNFYVRYQKPENRGLAGKSVMILDGTVPDEEFRALFVHESGHNWDLGCLTGSADSGKSSFSDGDEAIYKNDPSLGFYQISWLTSEVQRSDTRNEDFVSGYASYNIFEDFAESFAYFVLQNDAFAKRAQDNVALARKYIWLRDVLFQGNIPQIASGKSVWKGKVPWDITKLEYVWNAKEVTIAQNRT